MADDRPNATEYAEQLWPELTMSEQHGIRFGMFPAEKMKAAEAAGFTGRFSHDLVVALMDVAAKRGGMRA